MERELLLKLARGISSSRPLSKAASPIGSQFFDGEPSGVRDITLDSLLSELAGESFNDRWKEIIGAAGYDNINVDRPSKTADVTSIGTGGRGMVGNMAPLTAKAAALDSALRKNRAAKAGLTTADADTAVLSALLAEIVKALIGCEPTALDPSVVKSRFASALKKAGPIVQGQVKELNDALDEAARKAAFIAAGGKWERVGSRLSMSI
jgi:hypothetical protein